MSRDESRKPGKVEGETLTAPQGWRVAKRVVLVEDPRHGRALVYSPHGTARHHFPEWWDEDYEPPRRLEGKDAGSPLRPRDLAPTEPKVVEDEGLLDDFLRLVGGQFAPESYDQFARTHGEGARARRVRSLAQEHGPLLLCKHHLPFTHDETICSPLNPEPLRAWWELAHQCRSIVEIAQRLNRGSRGKEDDWATLLDCDPTEIRSRRQRGSWAEQKRLARVLERMLRLADFRLRFTWGESGPELDLLSPSTSPVPLYAALVRELVSTVIGIEETATCDGCRLPYTPDRKPRAGERNFCTDCREAGVPARLRKRDERRRKTESGNG